MSGSWPITIPLKSIQIASSSNVFVSGGQNNAIQTRAVVNSHRWLFRGSLVSSNDPVIARAFFAFICKQKNQYDTFTFTPAIFAPNGFAAGTPLVNGASQTGGTISIKGFSPNITGIMKAGDFLKFANRDKVYMVTADGNSDGSGNVTLDIFPDLFQSPAADSAVTITDVPFTVSFVDNIQSLDIEHLLSWNIDISFLEVPVIG